jgi:hypothetical protein
MSVLAAVGGERGLVLNNLPAAACTHWKYEYEKNIKGFDCLEVPLTCNSHYQLSRKLWKLLDITRK